MQARTTNHKALLSYRNRHEGYIQLPIKARRRKKENIIFIKYLALLLAFIIIGGSSIYFAFFQQSFVTPQQFEKYAKSFVANYNQSLSFFYPETFSSFDFYSNQSYEVAAYFSSNYGTAIMFVPFENWTFTTLNVSQRVEDAIFDNYNSLQLTKFFFQGDNTGFIAARNSNNSIIDIGMFADPGSNVLIKNVEINHVLYNCLIIKGGNQSSYWNNASAVKDSNRIFDADLFYALNRSEEVRERYYEPELNSRLVDILTKWNNAISSNGAITYTLTDKEHDFGEVIRLAETYGITNASDFVHRTFAYLQNATLPTPPPDKQIFTVTYKDDSNNVYYVTACALLPSFMFMLYSFLDFVRARYHSKDIKNWVKIATTITAVPFVASLYVERPYDYQLASIQTIVIIVLGAVLAVLTYKVKKRLSAWFFSRTNTNKKS